MQDEVLDILNEVFGTIYELEHPAADLFKDNALSRQEAPEGEIAAAAGTWASLLGCADLVSSDTDDDSYK